jgi:hypothetical protein
MDGGAVSVNVPTDNNTMRYNATIALADKKTPVSLEKQDLQSDSNAMRLTQCVTHDWKIGNCEHCKSEFQKRVTWQKFCSDNCRIAKWELTHGKTLKKKLKQH